MTTVDQLSQAEQDALASAVHDGTPTLDCTTCGRNCRHTPATAGGGTAGGVKGEKWTSTQRSALRCPSCGQKPHRKEGRIHQEVMCMWGQVCLKLGLTVLAHPTASIGESLYNMLAAGEIKPPPTERQLAMLLAGVPAETAMSEPTKGPRKNSINVPKASPGEEVEGMVAAPAIGLPDMPEMQAPRVIKTVEDREKERAEAKALKDQEKAKAKADKDQIRAAAKEQAAKDKAAKKAETKAEKEKRLLARAEADTKDETVIPDEIADPDYDPLAGVGEAFDDTDDDEEIPLTEAQMAALGSK